MIRHGIGREQGGRDDPGHRTRARQQNGIRTTVHADQVQADDSAAAAADLLEGEAVGLSEGPDLVHVHDGDELGRGLR